MQEFIEVPANNKSLAARKPIYGIGTNDAAYVTQITINGKVHICPYYKVWKSMFQRCYCIKQKQRQPWYKNCSICTEWHTFSNFKSWMETQEWEGNDLDKDFLKQGNKVYSSEFCTFIPHSINTLKCLLSLNNTSSTGVHWSIKRNKFQAQCCVNGRNKHLGYFDCKDLAIKKYLSFKKEVVLQAASLQQNLKLKDRLIQLANNF